MTSLDATGLNNETTIQASRGKPLPYTDFQYTTAEFTLPALGEYGLRYLTPNRPAFAPLYPVSVRRLIPLLHASFRPHLTMTPLRFANLHLHQVGIGTSTLLVSRHARHASSTTRRAGSMMKAPGGGYCQSPANLICSWRFSSRS